MAYCTKRPLEQLTAVQRRIWKSGARYIALTTFSFTYRRLAMPFDGCPAKYRGNVGPLNLWGLRVAGQSEL